MEQPANKNDTDVRYSVPERISGADTEVGRPALLAL